MPQLSTFPGGPAARGRGSGPNSDAQAANAPLRSPPRELTAPLRARNLGRGPPIVMHRPPVFVCLLAFAACTGSGAPVVEDAAVAAPVLAPAAPTPASPPPEPPPVVAAPGGVDLGSLGARLRRCNGGEGHPLGTVVRAEALGPWGGERVYLARLSGDSERPVLVFDADTDCPAFVLGAVTRVTGDWLGDRVPREAVLLSQLADGVSCDDDACPIALVITDPAGTVLRAVRPAMTCATASLEPLRLFTDRDSLVLRCSAGDVDEQRTIELYHAFDRELRGLLSFVDERASTEPEGEDRACTARSKGGYEVKASGAAPVVEVLEVEGIAAGVRTEWTFSPAEQRMIAGQRRAVTLPAPRKCGPL